jgi:hypothetical protein
MSNELVQVCKEATSPCGRRPQVITKEQAPTARKPQRRFPRRFSCCFAEKYLGRCHLPACCLHNIGNLTNNTLICRVLPDTNIIDSAGVSPPNVVIVANALERASLAQCTHSNGSKASVCCCRTNLTHNAHFTRVVTHHGRFQNSLHRRRDSVPIEAEVKVGAVRNVWDVESWA